MEIEVNDELFQRAATIYAQAAQRAATDIVHDAAARLSRILRKNTPPLIGGRTRKQHTDFLKARILEQRMPRGRLTKRKRSRPMRAATAARFFKVAKARQGEMISGWNALARAGGAKLPQWLARHGEKHGAATLTERQTDSTLRIRFCDAETKAVKRTDMARILTKSQRDVAAGLAGNAARILRARMKK